MDDRRDMTVGLRANKAELSALKIQRRCLMCGT
jgi:hypothetical protein